MLSKCSSMGQSLGTCVFVPRETLGFIAQLPFIFNGAQSLSFSEQSVSLPRGKKELLLLKRREERRCIKCSERSKSISLSSGEERETHRVLCFVEHFFFGDHARVSRKDALRESSKKYGREPYFFYFGDRPKPSRCSRHQDMFCSVPFRVIYIRSSTNAQPYIHG